MRKALVEYSGLNCKRRLRGQQFLFELGECAPGQRNQPERKRESEDRAACRDESDGNKQATHADARSVNRNDLAIGGKPAEADKNSDKYSHRNGEREHRRERTEKQE